MIAIRPDPAAYLRSFQPDQPQFEALRQKLIELAAAGRKTSRDIVKIPDGPVLKKGVENEQVALLRKRLEVPASRTARNENLFDDERRCCRPGTSRSPAASLPTAGRRRHAAAAQQHEHHREVATRQRSGRSCINMERWRWLPHDLGPFYVAVNIPEFMLRVTKEGKVIHTTRVVVGKTDKQTPIFGQDMQEIVFNPYWNVPNSIKTEEIRPYLREEALAGSAAAAGTPRCSSATISKSITAAGKSIRRRSIGAASTSAPSISISRRDRTTCSASSSSCFPTSTTSTCTTRRSASCSPSRCAPRAMAACACRIPISSRPCC